MYTQVHCRFDSVGKAVQLSSSNINHLASQVKHKIIRAIYSQFIQATTNCHSAQILRCISLGTGSSVVPSACRNAFWRGDFRSDPTNTRRACQEQFLSEAFFWLLPQLRSNHIRLNVHISCKAIPITISKLSGHLHGKHKFAPEPQNNFFNCTPVLLRDNVPE